MSAPNSPTARSPHPTGADGGLPPRAVEVEASPGLGAGVVGKGDWVIPSGSGSVRVVDERMAYGWNQCLDAAAEIRAARRIAVEPSDPLPPGAAEQLLQLLADTVSVAITMLYDSHPGDVAAEFSLGELETVLKLSEPLMTRQEAVEAIYRRALDVVLAARAGGPGETPDG